MRKPSYSVAHERENQRRRELEEEEERERERKAIAEEKEEKRRKREFVENYYQTYDPIPEPKQQQQPVVESNESLMMKMIKQIVEGPPPTIRIIARFGQSNYDITITKVEELEAVQAIVNKFINAFQPNPTQQSY